MDDYYFLTAYSPTHLLSMMYDEASREDNYYLSPVNVLRCDVSDDLRTELTKIINIPFADCGFLKTKPQETYPIHVDKFRVSAINMPLFDNIEGFDALIFNGRNLESIEYKTNYFTILNVMKHHCVKNDNLERERIMLSIGFKDDSYSDLLSKYKKGILLNAVF